MNDLKKHILDERNKSTDIVLVTYTNIGMESRKNETSDMIQAFGLSDPDLLNHPFNERAT